MTKLYNIHIFYFFLCHTYKRLNFHQIMDEGIAYPWPSCCGRLEWQWTEFSQYLYVKMGTT